MTPAQYYDAHPEMWETYHGRDGTSCYLPYVATSPATQKRVREAMQVDLNPQGNLFEKERKGK